LYQPVNFPRSALDAAEGNEVCGGTETADPMEDDTEERIRTHIALNQKSKLLLRRQSYLMQGAVWNNIPAGVTACVSRRSAA
jgi:hypothetical protein